MSRLNLTSWQRQRLRRQLADTPEHLGTAVRLEAVAGQDDATRPGRQLAEATLLGEAEADLSRSPASPTAAATASASRRA